MQAIHAVFVKRMLRERSGSLNMIVGVCTQTGTWRPKHALGFQFLVLGLLMELLSFLLVPFGVPLGPLWCQMGWLRYPFGHRLGYGGLCHRPPQMILACLSCTLYRLPFPNCVTSSGRTAEYYGDHGSCILAMLALSASCMLNCPVSFSPRVCPAVVD